MASTTFFTASRAPRRTGRRTSLHWPGLIGLAGALLCAPSLAQVTGQDAVDRALQERAVQQRALEVRLDDRPVPRGLPPEEVRRSITLPTPGTEILRQREQPPLPPLPRVAVPAAPVIGSQQLLDESQRRRQLELQMQLQPQAAPFEDPTRVPALQSQQLQFQREQSAERLGSEIMRNSERALRRP
jgi:hypothetical protein